MRVRHWLTEFRQGYYRVVRRAGRSQRDWRPRVVGRTLPVAVAAQVECLEARTLLTASLVVDLDFQGSSYPTDSGFIPPDTDGAVGINHFVEMINGRFSVYSKSDGALVQTSSLDAFWTNAGVTPQDFAFDPRVIFDHDSQRWFALSVDNPGAANSFLLAVSATANPTGSWKAFQIDSDSTNANWADFPTLGIDADGVYLSANMFGISDETFGVTVVSIPKSDLLLSSPSIANLAKFENQSSIGSTVQPAVDFGASDGRSALLGEIVTPLVRTNVLGAGTAGATLSSSVNISVAGVSQPPTADQPGSAANLNTGDARFSGSVFEFGDSLWAVRSVDVDGRSAIRWYEISEVTNAVLQTGTISDTALSFYFPSIAANEFGDIVIGFSGSGASQYASSYAILGQTISGVTSFGTPLLLEAGSAEYERLDGIGRNRWGDYSATTRDPTDPRVFWTIQEYASATNEWSTRITKLAVVPSLEIESITTISPNLRTTAVPSLDVTFSVPINLSTLTNADLSLTLDGGSNLLAGSTLPFPVTFSLVSGNTYRISGLANYTGVDGTYVFTIDASGLQDTLAKPGSGSASTSWVLSTVALPELSATFTGPRYAPNSLTFAELQGASNVPIAAGHTLGFRIDSLNGGTLSITHLGVTTTAGPGTIVVAGDTLTWTSLPGATGPTDAYRLIGIDLTDKSKPLALVQIRVDLVNIAPTLSAVTTLAGSLQETPFNITYAMLQGAANEFDANGDALGFRIRTVQNGSLTITKSGTSNAVPVVLAKTLVESGDVLTWTGGVGQSGDALPAFTIRAWDGLAGSGVDIQVTINVIPFGGLFGLSGPWTVGGKLAGISQSGASLTFTDQNRVVTTGGYTQFTTITGRNGLTGIVDTTTPDIGRIVWSDGAIWLRLSVGGQYKVSNPNLPYDPPALVKVVQNGASIKLFNRVGDSADASFITPAILSIPKWKLTATYADGALKISNGFTWNKLDLSPSYTESVSGLATGVRQAPNLATNTIELTFTDTAGGTSKGFWQSPTQVKATDWNSVGTVLNGRILWVGGTRDGEIWNKKLVLIGSGSGAGPGFVKIEMTNNQLLLTNKLGTVMHAKILDPFTLYNIDTGKLITRKNGKLDFGGGLVWSDFDFNALDAVFADITTFPFGS